MKLIELNIRQIFDLCRKHKVKQLFAFGSILTDRFSDDSDVDLLVDFESYDPNDAWGFDYVSNYFDFLHSLESLFKRKVDLIEDGNQLNPLFRASINSKMKLIYG